MDQEKLNRRLQIIANLGIVAGLVLVGVQLKQNSDLIKLQLSYIAKLEGREATRQEPRAPSVSVDTETPESRIRAARTRYNSTLLQSEVFTTLSCDGPPTACRKPDPIQ